MIEKTVIKEFIHRIPYRCCYLLSDIFYLYFNTASIINENSRLWYSQR